MKPQILAQAAEAIIYKKGNKVVKDRISKSYRIKELDNKIRKSRTKSEIKLLEKAGKIINTPLPIKKEVIDNMGGNSNILGGDNKIIMPFINGKKLSEHLDEFPLAKQKPILNQIGQDVAKLHDADIIHSDLTTSNMILVENNSSTLQKNKLVINKKFNKVDEQLNKVGLVDNKLGWASDFAREIKINDNERCRELGEVKVYFIDFGLGYISKKIEDKAVDIHLLKQALEAKHFKNWEVLFKSFLKGYSKSKDYKEVIERLKKVEARGRYKH